MPRFDPNDYNPDDRGDFTPPPEGDYSFVVVNAEEKTSQKGNEMLALQLAVDVGRERDLTVYANLVFTSAAVWMIHDFCASAGVDFSTGEITPDDVQGRTGVAHLVLGKPNSNQKRYMEVKYFKAREGYSEQPASGSMGQSNQRPQPPPDDYAPPPPTDDDAEARGGGGDNIPF